VRDDLKISLACKLGLHATGSSQWKCNGWLCGCWCHKKGK
jgi:hypothetical protein